MSQDTDLIEKKIVKMTIKKEQQRQKYEDAKK